MTEPKWAAPPPWDFMWISAPASGGGHLYIVDATGRKIAAVWGKADEKELTARLIAAAPNLYGALERMLRMPINGVPLRDWENHDIKEALGILAEARGES